MSSLGADKPVRTTAFPLPLCCPECGAPIGDENRCSCVELSRLQWHHGIPRTLFGQSYWGETSRQNMHKVLALLERMPWREALKEVLPHEGLYRHLLKEVGPDFVYSMPWNEIRTVLEIGAGMGFMTAPLAKFADTVVALEAVPERAEFIDRRMKQDGIANVYPLIASGTALPFEPESFDLVAMNGVFEYVGLWGAGEPKELGQQLLAKIFRLLKPGGYLYIGIETRYGWGAWLGARDHSGLAFTSVMPRWLADRYCRFRQVPFYGSATSTEGYRTYTYTPSQYEAMVRRAGFQTAEVFGCFDGYNRQIALYPLQDHHARNETLRIAAPASSRAGSIRRWVTDSRWFYKTLENEVVVFACKPAKPSRLFWSALRSPGAITQINTGTKINALLFEDRQPKIIAQAAKRSYMHERQERSFQILQRAEQKLGEEARSYSVRWARPLGRQKINRLDFFEYEFVKGNDLAKGLLPRFFRPLRLTTQVRQLTDGYVHMMNRLSTVCAPSSRKDWHGFLHRLSTIGIADNGLRERIQQACRALEPRAWAVQVVHGDLSFNNVILAGSGQMILVDWENMDEKGLPAIDLIRLLHDAHQDCSYFRPAEARRLMGLMRQAVTRALENLHIISADFRPLELLFVAHQYEFDHARQVDLDSLVTAYRDPQFSLLNE